MPAIAEKKSVAM